MKRLSNTANTLYYEKSFERYNWISDTGNAAHGAAFGHFAGGTYLDNWSSNC